jgi:hypothetical protein
MGYHIARPTENDFANSRVLISIGGLIFLGAVGTLTALRLILGVSLTSPWEHLRSVGFVMLSLGLATVMWGLRVYARKIEFESASRSGMTPAYEAACTMIAIVFVLAPIAAVLVAVGVIELPTFPSSR